MSARFNSIANCNELTIEDLVDILRQAQKCDRQAIQTTFCRRRYRLHFSPDALRAMAEKAKATGTGARALRMIVESMLLNLMFDAPSDPTICEILISKECVLDNTPPKVKRSS